MRHDPSTGNGATCALCGHGTMRPFAADERFETRSCAACGYLATAFRSGHEAPGNYYESVVDAGAFESSVGAVRGEQIGMMLDLLAERGVRGGRLLDIGCGYGWMLRAARRRGFEVAGIEPTDACRGLEGEAGFRVLRGFFPEVRYPGERFDVVTAIDVIEHIPLPALAGFLAEVRAALVAGGHLVLKVPDSHGIVFRGSAWAHRLSAGRMRGPIDRMLQLNYGHPHVSYFNRVNLTRYLEGQGFTVVGTLSHPEVSARTAWSRVTFENPPPLPLRAAYAGALAALWMVAVTSGRQDALVVVARPSA